VNAQHLSSIWNNYGFYYFATVFTQYFVDIIPEIEDLRYIRDAYEKYSRLVKERYEKWSLAIEQGPLKA
jgi:hypothetical protein